MILSKYYLGSHTLPFSRLPIFYITQPTIKLDTLTPRFVRVARAWERGGCNFLDSHRLHISSFVGLPYAILNMTPPQKKKQELTTMEP